MKVGRSKGKGNFKSEISDLRENVSGLGQVIEDAAIQSGESLELVALDVKALAVKGLRDARNNTLLIAVVIARARFVGHYGGVKRSQVKVSSNQALGSMANISGHGNGF